MATQNNLQNGLVKELTVPTQILASGLLSDTSHAQLCFMHQRFSAKLQVYMINYVLAVDSAYPISSV